MVSLPHLLVYVSPRAAASLAAIALAGAAATASAQPPAHAPRARLSADLADRLRTGDSDSTTVIVTATRAQVDDVAARHGLRVRKYLRTGAVLDVPARGLDALASDAAVDALSGNHPVFTQMSITNQAIGADVVQAGRLVEGIPGLTGKGVGIAVIDSGVDEVPQLQGRIVASVDFTGDDGGRGQRLGHAKDVHGHGTHVAGIAAASGVNAQDDTRGVAPDAHIISLKVLDGEGRGYADDVIEAIDWAIDNRERYQIGVINLSLGGPVLQSWRDDPVCQAVERAYRAGIVVVASAGNFGKDALGNRQYGGITMPGNSPFAITVGALNTKGTPWRSDDERASYSSMGPTLYDGLIKPDLLAPGNRIRGLIAPGSTLVMAHPELVTGTGRDARLELSGTSMAAPAVSGAAAILLAGAKGPTAVAVRILLQYSSEPFTEDGLLANGAGSLNVLAAAELELRGAVSQTHLHGEIIPAGQLFYVKNILWGSNILWGGAENILWGSAQNILWGNAENILWGSAENILWGSAENILWGSAENILWGSAENILWGSAENILWRSGENILWGRVQAD